MSTFNLCGNDDYPDWIINDDWDVNDLFESVDETEARVALQEACVKLEQAAANIGYAHVIDGVVPPELRRKFRDADRERRIAETVWLQAVGDTDA